MDSNQIQAEEYVKQANALHRQGEYEQAIDAYRKAMALMPNTATYLAYHFMIGDMLEEMVRYEDAVEAYQETVKAIPHYDEAWFNLSRCLLELGRDKEAVDAIDRFLEIVIPRPREGIVEPRYWLEMNERIGQAWYNGAIAQARMGEVGPARKYLENALEIRPGLKRRVQNEELLKEIYLT